jgi:hypothetical protein
MTSSLSTVVILSLILLACQESAPEANWTTDTGVDAADANTDARGDADPDDGGGDTRDVQDGGDEDTRPDCSKDSDGDMLNNCDEAELCTDPTNADTDEDGLSDFEELREGTDPCDPDTDDDGADDPTELDVGLNPNDRQTFDDGVLDGNRWRVDACAPPMDPSEDVTGTINFVTSQAANYSFGVPDDFSSVQNVRLSGVPPRVAAHLFGDGASSLHGFLVSKNADEGRTEPDVSARKTVRPAVLELAGNDEDNLNLSTIGGTFTTHDDHLASIARYKVTSPTAKTAAKVREELLLGLDAFSQENITGSLPSTAGPSYTSFRIFVSVIHRTKSSGPNQVVLSAAVAPSSVYDDNPQVRFDMDDLTNTTQISEAARSLAVGCVSTHPQDRRTGYTFPEVPVSGSLHVFWESDQDPTEATVVPRSRENGFAYFSRDNAVRMYGHYPQGYTGEYPENFVALRYQYFTSP